MWNTKYGSNIKRLWIRRIDKKNGVFGWLNLSYDPQFWGLRWRIDDRHEIRPEISVSICVIPCLTFEASVNRERIITKQDREGWESLDKAIAQNRKDDTKEFNRNLVRRRGKPAHATCPTDRGTI